MIRPSLRRSPALVAALCLAAGSLWASAARAQDEGALRAFFEGRRVAVRIDMPGTQEGVDVQVGSGRPVDFGEVGSRLKRYGMALRSGDTTTITLIKVKKDLIEFQLDGGGYGTLGDDTSTTVYIPYVEKSRRERELDDLIRDERDRDRRRRLERERDDLRDRRDRENRRIDARRAEASADKARLVMERRLAGGSRFNIRYRDRVPVDIRPEMIMAALGQYVDFGQMGRDMRDGRDDRYDRVPQAPPAPSRDDRNRDRDRDESGFGGRVPASSPSANLFGGGGGGGSDTPMPRKGMTREDAERAYGRPVKASERREGSVTITTLVFEWDDDNVLSADFVEGVLVRYSIASK